MQNKTFFLMLAVVSVVLGAGSFYVTQKDGAFFSTLSTDTSESTREALRRQGVYLFEEPIPVTGVDFINEENAVITDESLKGKWSLLFFGYTFCPDICPTTLAVMKQMWDQLPEDTQNQSQVVLVSVDPERDTPEQLKTYMDYFDPAFTSMTGNQEALGQLATQLNAVYAKVPRLNEAGEEDPELGYLMDHSANIAILNADGAYAGFIRPPFTGEKMTRLWQQVLAFLTTGSGIQ